MGNLGLQLNVDKSHERYSPDQRHPSYWNAPIVPSPPVTEWEVGTYHLVERPTSAAVLPYRMYTYFSVLTTEGSHVALLAGKKEGLIDLGWWAGLPE